MAWYLQQNQNSEQPRTYRQLQQEITDILQENHRDEISLDIQELISRAAGFPVKYFWQNVDQPVSDIAIQRINALLERYVKNEEPIAYIIGEWDFYGLTLYITPDVLIPRPDTEILAEEAIMYLRRVAIERKSGIIQVLDLCAGSGCIGLAIASQVKSARVTLADYSDAALSVCRKNIDIFGWNQRIDTCKVNALLPPENQEFVNQNPEKFDCIVCNPPYIPHEDILTLDKSVRDYEPHMALDGGTDGLDFYRSITRDWQKILRPGGKIFFEVGIHQAEAVRDLLIQAGFTDIEITEDYGHIERVVSGKKAAE